MLDLPWDDVGSSLESLGKGPLNGVHPSADFPGGEEVVSSPHVSTMKANTFSVGGGSSSSPHDGSRNLSSLDGVS